MDDLIQPGDIVRFRSQFLGRVGRIWASDLATVSGQLVSIECLGECAEWTFGPHLDALDLADIEIMAKGIPPDAVVEELGMEHPWIMARLQARIDASFARENWLHFADALAIAEARAIDLFGGAPQGWVATAVARVFVNHGYDSPEVRRKQQTPSQ